MARLLPALMFQLGLTALASASLLAGCRTAPSARGDTPSVQNQSTEPNSPASGGGALKDVAPVYAQKNGAPDPLAALFCDALHSLPEARRAACCASTPGITAASECRQALSSAIRTRAVRLSQSDVESCQKARSEELTGCDWVGPFPPAIPAACRGILYGNVKSGEACRSSLECTNGLACQGAGPTQAGRCAPAKPAGAACNLGVDTLASYTRQESELAQHRECNGYCQRHTCLGSAAEGGACTLDLECGPGQHCRLNRCVKGLALKIGDVCSGAGCEPGSRCYQNRCTASQNQGASCESDFECRGGCLKPPNAARGVCGARCDIR